MDRTERRRGARSLRVSDWPFGSHGRRLFLEAVLLADAPGDDGWTKRELEDRVDVERGGVDRLLSGAAALDLVRVESGRWRRVDPRPEIAGPLEELARLAQELSDETIPPLPKRSYTRRR